MLSWVHVLAWPVAAVWISGNARVALAAVAMVLRPKKEDDG